MKEKVKKVCLECGKAFATTNGRKKFCSYDCQKRNNHRKYDTRRSLKRGSARRAFLEAAKMLEVERVRRHREKLMADIFSPIGDDEPLSNYIGRMA